MIYPLSEIKPTGDVGQWAALCVGLLAVVYLMMRGKARGKRDPLEGKAAPGLSLAQQRQVERQMSDLLVELSEMARQISAQLDTRAAKLESLIKEADEKIARLESLANHAARLSSSSSQTSETPRMTIVRPPDDDEPAPAIDQDDARHASIYTLADQGIPAHDIATRLGRPSGEIELILALRTK